MCEKTMKKPSIADRILEFLKNNPGRHKTAEITKAIGGSNRTSSVLGELAESGEIQKIKNGTYSRISTSAETSLNDNLNEISDALRSPDANKNTIDKLMNLYDNHVERYTEWFAENINSNIDFEKQLLFIENFKWLTMIGDKLMKRWSLEHVGYDSNSRQAQEDAKAKAQAREKAALEDAPLEDTVQVVGHYHTDLKELWDAMPESEKEKRKV